jgi:hypothetical protein
MTSLGTSVAMLPRLVERHKATHSPDYRRTCSP